MPEIPTAIDKCEGCGKKGRRAEAPRVGLGRSLVLNKDGLCADCAPPAMRCALGEPCEVSRVVKWDPDHATALKKLRLCDAHGKERTNKLRAAKKASHG